MLGIAPDAVLVDLTHDIPPHDVLQGALAAGRGRAGTFRPGPSFLPSWIPASGSTRRGIAAEAGGLPLRRP